jgi:hypothetical protein
MAYYYDQDGNKIPVDSHSTPEEKDAAAQQEQANARAANGDNSAGGDAGGVQAPGAAGQVDNSGKTVDGPVGNTQGTPITKEQKAAAAAAADAAAKAAAAKAAYEQAQSHFEYGGWAGGASEAASRYAKLGADAQGRAGESLALGAVNDDRNANAQARGNQMSIAQLIADRASGKTPSIAGMVGTQNIGRALADQSSIAASARGPAALALAQQQQANNSANAVSTINNQTEVNSAVERQNAENAAMGAYTGIRGGDQSLMGADAGVSIAQANINANQRAENDRFQLGMTGAETDVQKAQLNAQGNQVGIQAGVGNAAAARDQAAGFHSDDRTDKYIGIGAGPAATAGGLILANALGGSSGNGGAAGGVSGGYGTGGTAAGPGGAAGSSSGQAPGDGAFNAGDAIGSGSSGDGSVPDPISSDVRGKTGIAGEGSRVDAFLEGIHPLSYHYKDSVNEPRSKPTGGRYLGISAQDLEAVPEVGHQLVSDGPRGKQVEVGPSLSAALAGIARLHERVKAVESGGDRVTDKDRHDLTNGPSNWQVEWNRSRGNKSESGMSDEQDYNNDPRPYDDDNTLAMNAHGGGIARHITSDMAAKTDVATEGAAPYVDPRAKAWDEGHNAALDKVQQMRMMSPDELKALGDKGNRLANAVRGAKADAYDEARGISQHIMQPRPGRQMASFQRGDEADMSKPAPLASLYTGGQR